jgi:phage/plasmid-associated DNA primase
MELDKVINTIYQKYKNNYPIPCTKFRSPIYKHKDFQYDWDFIEDRDNNVTFENGSNVGLIVNDLLVIDIDDKEYIDFFEEKFPYMKQVVSETTTKGKHYYFKRTKQCDDLEIYTLIKCITLNQKKIDIDCITKYSNGTGAIIIIAPSPNKNWVVPIYEKEIEDIPEDLLNFLKVNWSGVKKDKKKDDNDNKKERMKDEIYNASNEIVDIINDEIDINILKGLIDIIKYKMSHSYDNWIKVGWSLYNTYKGSKEGLELWDHFSKACEDKYDPINCKNMWKTMKVLPNGYSEGSLRWWAKSIDMELYQDVLKKNIRKYVISSASKNDLDLATVVYILCKNEFIIFNKPDGKRIGCWRFFEHRWRIDGINYLKRFITQDVVKLYYQIANEIKKEADSLEDKDDKETKQELSKVIIGVSNCFKSATKLQSILSMLGVLMAENSEDVLSKINENQDLICFENGVYDLQNKEFRIGRPSDYITFSTGYDYVEEDDLEIQSNIKDILWKSSESDDIYQFNLDISSYCLSGKKLLEIYSIWYGDGGRGGKGLYSKLLSMTFGDYYTEIKANNFTDPNDSKGGTDSEIAKLKGRRLVVSTEPAKNAKLQLNRIKEWTGGDRIKARELYESSIEFICQFYIIIQANHPPANSCHKDRANEKRVKAVPWVLEFVDEPTKENERQVDTSLKSLIVHNEKYKQQYMRMLIKNFERIYDYKKQNFNIVTPDIIQETTKKLLTINNEFMLWFDENFEKSINPKDYVGKFNLYKAYKVDYPVTKKTTFYKYMEENGFKLSKLDGAEIYRGIKPKPDNQSYLFH